MAKLVALFSLIGLVICIATNDEADIEEPCKDSDDINQCVRDFLTGNGQCEVIDNPSTGPAYFVGPIHAFVPKINTTFTLTKYNITEMDGKIETFHVNKKSDNIVMSVDFDGVQVASDDVYFTINQRNKEPKVVKDFAKGTYSVLLTAVIPANQILSDMVSQALVSGYISHPETVKYLIGSNFTASEDPVVSAAAQQMTENIPTVVQELFLTGAPKIFFAYMQHMICRF